MSIQPKYGILSPEQQAIADELLKDMPMYKPERSKMAMCPMSNIDKRPYRADGGDISTGRLREIADNPYGDEEKCWLAKRVLALLDDNTKLQREKDVMESAALAMRDDMRLACEHLGGAEKRIAELEARAAPDSFNIIGENIRTQDSRITSEPMFCVYQKREVVTDADYDHDRIVWVDEDGNEANERQRMRLELLHGNFREPPEKWRRVAVKEINEFVTCCFTEQGCKEYLACNGHNLRLPFIYVKSGFRNAEYIGVRNWLTGIGKGE